MIIYIYIYIYIYILTSEGGPHIQVEPPMAISCLIIIGIRWLTRKTEENIIFLITDRTKIRCNTYYVQLLFDDAKNCQ